MAHIKKEYVKEVIEKYNHDKVLTLELYNLVDTIGTNILKKFNGLDRDEQDDMKFIALEKVLKSLHKFDAQKNAFWFLSTIIYNMFRTYCSKKNKKAKSMSLIYIPSFEEETFRYIE